MHQVVWTCRVLLLAFGIFIGAVGTTRADTLIVCTEANPDSLNAQLSTTSYDISEQVSDRLVEIETGGSALRPGLAESWAVSPDGLTYTFRLRHGVEWQSNRSFKPTRPMDADDVVFSFQRMMDRSNPFYRSANGNFPEFVDLLEPNLASIEKNDSDAVSFKLRAPFAPLLAMLSMQSFSILSAEYAESLVKAGRPGDLDRELIGTGPFSFVEYRPDALVRFRAFPRFWGKSGGAPDAAAKVDNLVFSITPDPAVRYAKLRRDECQIVRYPNPADLPTMRADQDIVVLEADIAAINYLFFQNEKRPFDDRRVRQALAMAIDLDHLVEAVFEGSGTKAAALVPPSLWGHDSSLQPYPHDPDRARKLLAEAGYPDGFTTELWAMPVVRPYLPNGRRAAEMIQSDWARIGVRANIVTYEWGEYLKRTRAGEAPTGMLGSIWDFPDPSEILLGFLCHSFANESRFCNAEYDNAVRQANVVIEQNARAALYRKAQQIVYDQVPLMRLADVKAYVPIRKSVHGFKPHFLGAQRFGGVSLQK
jgi:dipeptide transport system substrate-binding protein